MDQDDNSQYKLLYQWYAIKPLAIGLFNNYQFEKYWIKNAWICFYEGIQDEKLRNSITIDSPEEEINDEIKVWLVALYKLYHVFKKVIDLEGDDAIDVEACADNVDLDIKSYYEKQLWRQNRDKKWSNKELDKELDGLIWKDLQKREEIFIKIIKEKFKDPLKIVEFFCNTNEVLDLSSYLKVNEDQCNSLEEFFEIEENKYPEYQKKIEADPVLDSSDINIYDSALGGIVSGKLMQIYNWIENGFSY